MLKGTFLIQIVISIFLNVSDSRPQGGSSDCKGNDLFVLFEDCFAGVGQQVDQVSIRSGSDENYVCCPPDKVLGDQIRDANPSCSDHPGFSCKRHVDCLNSQILSISDDKVLKVVTTRNSTITIEINPSASKCKSDLEVCCKPKSSAEGAQLKSSNIGPLDDNVKQKLEYPDDFASRCGRHNLDGIDIRIIDSKEGNGTTQVGEWPHMCIIFYRDGEDTDFTPRVEGDLDTFIGGASLIAPGIVMTAAHKVFDKKIDKLSVRCGVWDIKHFDIDRPSQEREVGDMIIHPSFYRAQVYYNYALLFLKDEFKLDDHIDTICLPKVPKDTTEFEWNNCVATGYGKDNYNGQYQRAMKQVELPLMEHQKCEEKLRTKKTKTFQLHESFLCAGGAPDGGDTCEGDGGGPLVCPASDSEFEERFIQVGIVSWGVKCKTPEIPGVYASIPEGLCFIDWSTKCLMGEKYNKFYDVQGCANWIDDEIGRLEAEKTSLENKIENPNTSQDGKDKSKTDLRRIVQTISLAEELESKCGRR